MVCLLGKQPAIQMFGLSGTVGRVFSHCLTKLQHVLIHFLLCRFDEKAMNFPKSYGGQRQYKLPCPQTETDTTKQEALNSLSRAAKREMKTTGELSKLKGLSGQMLCFLAPFPRQTQLKFLLCSPNLSFRRK